MLRKSYRTTLGAILILCAPGLSGCGTVAPPPVVERITRPEIGVVTSKEIGDPLFETILAQTYDGIRFAEGTRIDEVLMIIVPTGPFILTSSNSTAETFCGPAVVGGSAIPDICISSAQLKDGSVKYTRGPVTKSDPANFQRQIVYEGRVGKELHLSYREFSGDFARPAFTQELTFDLSDSKIVGVKGARIEVLNTSNVDIQYRVLQPFSD